MRPIRKSALIAAAAVAALTLAACSSSSEEPASSPSAAASAPAATGTIVDVAVAKPDFSTLVAAVQAAGLAETLSGAGPFTVFAPTNAAFEALPAGVVDALLLPENKETLTKILTYAVPGKVMAADVAAGDVATVEGQTIALATDGGVTVNGAKVIQADIEGSNGVIHVIDPVLLPPDVDAAALIAE